MKPQIFKKLKEKGARLIAITAVNKKNLIYHFFLNGKLKNIKIRLKENKTNSIIKIFPNAEFYEREIYETFGIRFRGNKNLKPLFLTKKIKPPLK
jgi:NADH:ubiquinone oxidoreductase subunit C